MKESFFLSLRFRIAINLILGVVVPMLAAIWFTSFHAANIIRSPAPQNLELRSDVLTESISRWEQMNIQVLRSLSQNPGTVSMNASQQLPLLAAVNRSYSDIYLAEADNLEGYVVARGSGTAPDRLNRSDRHWFKSAVGGTEITREAAISGLTGKPAVIFSTPIREIANLSTHQPAEQLGKIQGVAMIGTLLNDLASSIATVSLGKTGLAFLVDEQGQLIAHADQQLLAGKQLTNLSNYPPVKALLAGQSGAFNFADERGVKWLSHLKKLDSGWGVVILQQEAEALEKVHLFWQLAMTITAITVMVAGSLMWILTSRLVRQIEQLTFAAERLSGGDWNHRVNIDRQDELGTLAAAFNGMAVELQNLFAGLEAKNQEAELARIEAVETSKAKSRFLANMSFDFRCPLNAIIGYSGMLEEELLELNHEEIILDLQEINKAGLHLLSIINDILDVSKIEAGTIKLYLEVSEISAIISNVATKIQPVADKKCNILTVNCPPDIGTAYTDVPKISQCLSTLLTSANKFTEAGEITIEVGRFSRNMKDGRENQEEEFSDLGEQEQASELSDLEEWISFKVSYTGIGMNPEEIEKAFQHFTKVDNSTGCRYGNGTVLGLAITKNFCQIMGGDISLESEVGKGSTFIIELPAIVAERAAS